LLPDGSLLVGVALENSGLVQNLSDPTHPSPSNICASRRTGGGYSVVSVYVNLGPRNFPRSVGAALNNVCSSRHLRARNPGRLQLAERTRGDGAGRSRIGPPK